jgi:hypothetical protein
VSTPAETRAPLEVGVLITLVSFGLAGLLGLIAVLDADEVGSAFGTGLGVAFVLVLAGATIACALSCLRRGRAEVLGLGGIVVSALAVDLLVLAILLDVENEAYGKVTGVAFVWSFFALVILGLRLGTGPLADIARLLYLGTLVATVVAGLISTWLIGTAGDGGIPAGGLELVPAGTVGDDELLRALGGCLVAVAALWFAALAASRLERADAPES